MSFSRRWTRTADGISFIGTSLRNAVDRVAAAWDDFQFRLPGVEYAERALPPKDELFLVVFRETERVHDVVNVRQIGYIVAAKFRLQSIDIENKRAETFPKPVQTWKIMFIAEPGHKTQCHDVTDLQNANRIWKEMRDKRGAPISTNRDSRPFPCPSPLCREK